MDISALGGGSTIVPGSSPAAESPATKSSKTFTDALGGLLESVEQSSGAANDAVGQMLDGTGDVHDAMIALQRADMTLQLTVQVRNKLVQAYQEIMRMPV